MKRPAVASRGKRKLKNFQRLQYRFAAHVRDPQRHPAPAGIEPRRMKIYAELFYNNVESVLARAFPVLRAITPDPRWRALVRDFFARHESHEPLFHKMAGEFLKYLKNERHSTKRTARQDDPPFLCELAHYEWVELALAVSEVQLTPDLAHPEGDLLEGIPVLSPLAWSLAYKYPVHRINPDCLPEKPGTQPTHLIVYRTRQDEVKFLESNGVTARLITLLEHARTPGRRLLQRLARELQHPDPAAVVRQGATILNDLRRREIILGTRH